ncbi:RagB/SusD family nutrient uptake outer membrane protein [uncultured Acetobacteroides sp.]|uniref:RagB/SusD family nutrient uptake outer membrane protein n=1 Tax=uncultured Acetobacteroides sp. TaxID=1760811 RepID=UPI0029F4703C|nr:RagB/SusD family nutrient uptake outer membrane protein [uncultured Acetobacteroides sp.]
MKQIYLLALCALFFVGCSQSFLDTEELTKKTGSNFPGTEEEANQALVGAYSILPSFAGTDNILLISELMSDDRFGGGGQNDREPQAMNVFRVTNDNQYNSCWATYYKGIYRCNSLLSTIGNAKFTSEDSKKKIIGETSFLRAYFYFDLARLFGQVPLVLTAEPVNLPKATPEEIYGQIALDLKTAIEDLPAKPLTTENMGRATKWAAEGIMARMFLFYTGYYNKTEIALPGGGTITKQNVIDWVDDCIAHSGHSLVGDFRNQWPYSIAQDSYGYAKANKLVWVGETGANKENIFQINFNFIKSSVWGEKNYYCNKINLFFGLRNAEAQIPFGHGWGMGPVNPKFYEEWPNDDIRKQGSIWKVDDTSEGTDTFVWGADMMWQETGYIAKKYIPINVLNGGKKQNYSVKLYGADDDFSLNNTQNVVVLRLADVMLMGAELGSKYAQKYFDDVRGRVGLTSVPVNLDNIMKERRYELAFEGIRYFDMLRWYGKEAGVQLKKNMTGAKIFNMKVPSTINADRNNGYFDQIDARVKATGGFLMIPNNQIQLSKGVLVQNPGYTNSSDYIF